MAKHLVDIDDDASTSLHAMSSIARRVGVGVRPISFLRHAVAPFHRCIFRPLARSIEQHADRAAESVLRITWPPGKDR